ncbi:MAG: alpha-amylase [Anaerolineae bacterium]|nr:alpha-amylase [Anaerolineae bacterium]
MSNLNPLQHVQMRLSQAVIVGRGAAFSYAVPGRWAARAPAPLPVNPYRFYLERIDFILAQPPGPLPPGAAGEWSRQAVVYNMLLRATAAFDHDGDGAISVEPVGDGWQETGTFLKAIALLPTLREMGYNTIHLLPITAVGQDGRKGNLGSVYGIQNPYRLDPRLAEPALGLGAAAEFAAFTQAAHHLGMRVVVEFAFRTASLDADWVADHPEWFYWIRADVADRQPGETGEDVYGAPLFTGEELAEIKEKVERGDLTDLPAPHPLYRRMFTPPPPAESVRREAGRWIGVLPDGTRVRIPGAFADWPPDDLQPPWTDVTYLRLYDHPDFNYIAYNTLRMYDQRLARPENRVEPLWKRLVEILPYYQQAFGIDGAMVDMGHALPTELKRRIVGAARQECPDFAFWDESFTYTPGLQEQGYNAIMGNYWWAFWRPEHLLSDVLRPLAEDGVPIPFFAAPESHNTPRAAARPGGIVTARQAWLLGCILPAIPFCHSGFELGETLPVNTGLDFEEPERYPAAVLPLFSAAVYDWTGEAGLGEWIEQTLAIRARYGDLITDPEPAALSLLETDNPCVVGVLRQRGGRGLVAWFNLDPERRQSFAVRLAAEQLALDDLLTGQPWVLRSGWLKGTLAPGESVLLANDSGQPLRCLSEAGGGKKSNLAARQ